MAAQELITYAIGALALGYLGLRIVRRKLAGNCCGEKQCPAAKQIVQRIGDSSS